MSCRHFNKKAGIITFLLITVMSFTGCGARQQRITFNEHLDDVAVTVDGKEHLLREMSFYVAYEEQTMDSMAEVYESDDTNAFWNIYTNGSFLRDRTGKEAMNLAVHDFVFYDMAMEIEMELSEDERIYASCMAQDFWSDMEDGSHEKLGIDYEEFEGYVVNMALAQKYQTLYAAMEDVEFDEYNINGYLYDDFIESHEVKINNNVWEGLVFGRITLD